jgi:D-alanyl-D-alanine carboxypeptidase
LLEKIVSKKLQKTKEDTVDFCLIDPITCSYFAQDPSINPENSTEPDHLENNQTTKTQIRKKTITKTIKYGSFVKIMTVLLLLDHYQKEFEAFCLENNEAPHDIMTFLENKKILIKKKAVEAEGFRFGLKKNQSFSVKELLILLGKTGGNDIALSLVEEYAKNITEDFVMLMQGRSHELGLHSMNFHDCTGFSPENFGTQEHIMQLFLYVIYKYPALSKMIWGLQDLDVSSENIYCTHARTAGDSFSCLVAWMPQKNPILLNSADLGKITFHNNRNKNIVHKKESIRTPYVALICHGTVNKKETIKWAKQLMKIYEEEFVPKKIFKAHVPIGKIPVRYGQGQYENLYLKKSVFILKATDPGAELPHMRFVFPQWIRADAQRIGSAAEFSSHAIGFLEISFPRRPHHQRIIFLQTSGDYAYHYRQHWVQKLKQLFGYQKNKEVMLYEQEEDTALQ